MKHPSWLYRAAWAAWGAGGLGVEILAIRDKGKDDTLTEQLRAITKRPVLWWMAAGLLVWFLLHILGRGRLG